MDVNGKIQSLIDAAQQRADAAQKEVDAAEAEVSSLQEMTKQIDADKLAQYQAGTEYGKSLIVLPDSSSPDKIYSQSEADTLVASVKAEKDKEAADAAQVAAQKAADDLKALNDKYADYDAIKTEHDQMLKSTADDKQAVADAKAELDKRLDALAESVG